ncbi:MAG: YqgE/AlgH family protein [Planctomycetes bacterium]|nr:YqgE/AlgH family protein [Planctomycetota bacterium]
MSTLLKVGDVLVAQEGLQDPCFEFTVILIITFNDDGALGLVVNRDTDLPLTKVLTESETLQTSAPVMAWGGPVEEHEIHALHNGPPNEESLQIFSNLHFGGSVPYLEQHHKQGGQVRLFAGSCGWEAGQLENELEEKTWHVVRNAPIKFLATEQKSLWARLIREQSEAPPIEGPPPSSN